MAYQIDGGSNWTSVLRGGFGIFYDLGSSSLGGASSYFPYSASNFFFGATFPLSPQNAAPPPLPVRQDPGKIYALVVGISAYKNLPPEPLQFAEKRLKNICVVILSRLLRVNGGNSSRNQILVIRQFLFPVFRILRLDCILKLRVKFQPRMDFDDRLLISVALRGFDFFRSFIFRIECLKRRRDLIP